MEQQNTNKHIQTSKHTHMKGLFQTFNQYELLHSCKNAQRNKHMCLTLHGARFFLFFFYISSLFNDFRLFCLSILLTANEWFCTVTDLIKLRDVMRVKGHEVYVRQVDQSNYYRVLEDLKIKEFFNIIVDIRPERMVDLLNVVSFLVIIFNISIFCIKQKRWDKMQYFLKWLQRNGCFGKIFNRLNILRLNGFYYILVSWRYSFWSSLWRNNLKTITFV